MTPAERAADAIALVERVRRRLAEYRQTIEHGASAQRRGQNPGTAPGGGVSMAPAPPVRDLVVLQIRADLEGRRPTPRRSLGTGRQSRAAHRLKATAATRSSSDSIDSPSR